MQRSKLLQCWEAKCDLQRRELRAATETLAALRQELEDTKDAAEAMVTAYEREVTTLQRDAVAEEQSHRQAMKAIATRRQRCETKRERCLEEERRIVGRVECDMQREKEVMTELIALEAEKVLRKEKELIAAKEKTEEFRAALERARQEVLLMEDDSYGLSGEVKDLVIETKGVERDIQATLEESMRLEIIRRELFSESEALKGSIRVYSRIRGRPSSVVKSIPSGATGAEEASEGGWSPRTTTATEDEEANSVDGDVGDNESGRSSVVSHPSTRSAPSPSESRVASTAIPPPSPSAPLLLHSKGVPLSSCSQKRVSSPTWKAPMRSSSRQGATAMGTHKDLASKAPSVSSRVAHASRDGTGKVSQTDNSCAGELFKCSPCPRDMALLAADASENNNSESPSASPLIPNRTLTVHQVRRNATSTGTNAITESFTFDRAFDASTTQQELYAEVEPLIQNAVDGYSICIFAYGQTGSGKTYSMEGNLSDPAQFGITPRAMHTIFDRSTQLSEEGWRYEFRCSVIEIYNDSVRDLLQSPSIYEAGGAAFQQSNYHLIQHHAEEQRTAVSNVCEEVIRDYSEFLKLYQRAVRHRRTSSTTLNARSSRSHCICVIRLDGVNDTIRQRSKGNLCLVDLAGSERVNDSGVQGQQLKEAININKSLLDLGKCISAMRTNAVVPWRNSKLTHFLQLYLGARGGKMLMLVTVSDRREHVSETVNALRFASRVSETVVGPSVKRSVAY